MTERSEQMDVDRALMGFRAIAQERTADLCVDERMVARVRSAIEQLPHSRKPHGLAIGLAAAACLLVMLLSGGLLLPNLMDQGDASTGVHKSVVPTASSSNYSYPQTLSTEELSYSKDGTPLPYAIVSVEAYSEGFAVAQASNGLYGYVDEEGLWVLSAIYEKALPVSEGYANVVYNGREMTVAVS